MRILAVVALSLVAGCEYPPPLEADGGMEEGSDAGRSDAGSDDAGAIDAGGVDAGATDGGFADAGVADAGGTDAGSFDAGASDAGVDAGSDAGQPVSTNPQDHYSYPACTNPNPPFGCPNSNLYFCALQIIEDKHNGCSGDPDCMVITDMTDCQGAFVCGPRAVNRLNEAAFRAEAQVEITAYCDGGKCGSAPSCAYSYSHGAVRCLSNRCEAIPDCDGGQKNSDGGCL